LIVDGRKNNKGIKGKAGRKPKADELQLLETMDAILAPQNLWAAIANKVQNGDSAAMKIWASYRYGMPKQQVDMNTTIVEFPAPIIELPNE
jgi:hypothetical protein